MIKNGGIESDGVLVLKDHMDLKLQDAYFKIMF